MKGLRVIKWLDEHEALRVRRCRIGDHGSDELRVVSPVGSAFIYRRAGRESDGRSPSTMVAIVPPEIKIRIRWGRGRLARVARRLGLAR